MGKGNHKGDIWLKYTPEVKPTGRGDQHKAYTVCRFSAHVDIKMVSARDRRC